MVWALVFLTVFRTSAVFPPLGDGKFLHLPLALAMDRHKKKGGQNRHSVLGGSMNPGDLSGRDVKVPAGLWAMCRKETSKAFKAKLFRP